MKEDRNLADNMLSAINSGKSFKEVAKSNGLSLSSAGNLLKAHFGKNYKTLREEAFKEALKKIESGEIYSFELRRDFGLSPRSFYRKLVGYHKSPILLDESERRPLGEDRIGDLINTLKEDKDYHLNLRLLCGDDLASIARDLGVEHQAVDAYLLGTGFYSLWKERRRNNINKSMQEIINILRAEIPFANRLKPESSSLQERVDEAHTIYEANLSVNSLAFN